MAESKLMRFEENAEFLRRVMLPDHFKHDLLLWRAFKDRDVRMSLTHRDDTLQKDEDIDAYHEYFSERARVVLAAILWLSFIGLTRRVEPPLEPQLDPDDTDLVYGHLHCSTRAPHDKAHMQILAKLVNDGEYAGVLRRSAKKSA